MFVNLTRKELAIVSEIASRNVGVTRPVYPSSYNLEATVRMADHMSGVLICDMSNGETVKFHPVVDYATEYPYPAVIRWEGNEYTITLR
jgi:hypothetical protein